MATRPTVTPKGELRVAVGIDFPVALDATKTGFTMVRFGMGETLTRLTPENKLEPWLAQSVTNLDPATWRVVLRPNLTFWDGTPADAQAVIAAFKSNWETQPAASSLIDKATEIVAVNPTTLEFKVPKPAGNFPYALSAQYFVIHKNTGTVMTGAYRPTKFEVDREMTLEAFAGYWGGPPPLARIVVKFVQDANTRALALQSGDLDLLHAIPPETLKTFGPDIEAVTVPSARIHLLNLNGTHAPFSDRALREATAWAIDRAALLKAGLDGQGSVANAVFPPNSGLEGVPLQGTDTNRARQLLDDAGWKPGPDGVRAKDGKRLAFTLYTYPGRAELIPIAVTIQAQLKPLGYDVAVTQVPNIVNQLKDPAWDAAMDSINSLVTGDPLYFFNQKIVKAAPSNYSGYEVPGLAPLVEQLRAEADPARRQAISRQMQERVRDDVPLVFTVIPPIILAMKRGKVRNLVPHPNDLYFINTAISVV